ncbi:MAG: peptidylprolyl isomerase [Acidobacteria bacterium]|nr:peptidylprolyl isomerase [Acidobacteriota bacterium]
MTWPVLLVTLAFPLLGANPRVILETELGEIEFELDPGRAPGTSANFLRYVDAGHYNGGRFHRTVKLDNQPANPIKIQVIQAGVNPEYDKAGFDPIPLERTTKTRLRHKDAAVSMARSTPDSARSDFFICIGDQPALDYGGKRNPDGQGFAAFAKVVKGMDVVKRIQMSAAVEQRLAPPIAIRRAFRK